LNPYFWYQAGFGVDFDIVDWSYIPEEHYREKLADKDVKHSDRKSVLISERPDLLSNFRFRQSVISP
jgi:hypothetical protein